jgi:hypothetical protein
MISPRTRGCSHSLQGFADVIGVGIQRPGKQITETSFHLVQKQYQRLGFVREDTHEYGPQQRIQRSRTWKTLFVTSPNRNLPSAGTSPKAPSSATGLTAKGLSISAITSLSTTGAQGVT